MNNTSTLANWKKYATSAINLNTLKKALDKSILPLMQRSNILAFRQKNPNIYKRNTNAAKANHNQGLAQRNLKEQKLQKERNAQMRAYAALRTTSSGK